VVVDLPGADGLHGIVRLQEHGHALDVAILQRIVSIPCLPDLVLNKRFVLVRGMDSPGNTFRSP
jgi:hypothetical protein